MKTQEREINDLERRRFEMDLEAGVRALFRRRPTLCGFAVRRKTHVSRGGLALPGTLVVGEVSVYPMSGLQAPSELCGEIVAVFLELMEGCPEAREMLRERTFARVFH